jgi:hypothetical protein
MSEATYRRYKLDVEMTVSEMEDLQATSEIFLEVRFNHTVQ